MKYFLLAGLMVMMAGRSWGQVEVHQIISRLTGDTGLETGYDTLSVLQISKRHAEVGDKVLARLHKIGGVLSCTLFIEFEATSTFSLSDHNIAYFKTMTDSIVTVPNFGSYHVYTSGEHASFLLDVSKYLSLLKDSELKEIRLELSPGIHAVPLEERFRRKVADLISALLAHN